MPLLSCSACSLSSSLDYLENLGKRNKHISENIDFRILIYLVILDRHNNVLTWKILYETEFWLELLALIETPAKMMVAVK
jgi:hypothetical protein